LSREKTRSFAKSNDEQQRRVVQTLASVLTENGESINKTCEATGLARSSVQVIRKDPEKFKSLAPAEMTSLQSRLASNLASFAMTASEGLEDKIEKASLKDTMTAIAIAIDKMRIMCGLATTKTETVTTVLHKKIKAQSFQRLDMNTGIIEAKVKPDEKKANVPVRSVKAEEKLGRTEATETKAKPAKATATEMPPPVTPGDSEYVYTPSHRSTKNKGLIKKKPLPDFTTD